MYVRISMYYKEIEVGASYVGIICYFESKIDPDQSHTNNLTHDVEKGKRITIWLGSSFSPVVSNPAKQVTY